MEGTPPDDCTLCGACCFSDQADYLRVFAVDESRLTEADEAVIRREGNHVFMRIEGGHCAALRVDPRTRQLLCSIYPRRPDVCRALMRGGGDCRQHFAQKRILARSWCESLRRTLGIV